jgi:hypothetical protein
METRDIIITILGILAILAYFWLLMFVLFIPQIFELNECWYILTITVSMIMASPLAIGLN